MPITRRCDKFTHWTQEPSKTYYYALTNHLYVLEYALVTADCGVCIAPRGCEPIVEVSFLTCNSCHKKAQLVVPPTSSRNNRLLVVSAAKETKEVLVLLVDT